MIFIKGTQRTFFVCAINLFLLVFWASAVHAKGSFILAQAMTTDHIFHASSERFVSTLKEMGSELEVEYHPGGALGDWTSQFEQTMWGVIPMTMTYAASEFDSRLDLTWLGYVVDNWDSAREVYGPNGGMLEVYNTILDDMGLVALGTIPAGFGSIAIRKGVGKAPTSFPEDARGIKMRVVPTPLAVARFNNLGFSAVAMPFSELYTGLQLGTVDGRAFGPAVEIWQMRDVLESYILTRDYFEHGFWLVNKDWWEALPSVHREQIQAAADEALSWAWSESEAIDNSYLERVRDHGITVVELSDEDLTKAKNVLYANEWPAMEAIVGEDVMNMMRKIAGID